MKETETHKAIEAEARKLYPDYAVTGNPLIYGKRIGYIAGRSASDEAKDSRIRELEEDNKKLRGFLLEHENWEAAVISDDSTL